MEIQTRRIEETGGRSLRRDRNEDVEEKEESNGYYKEVCAMKIEYFHASKYGNGVLVADEFKEQMAARGIAALRGKFSSTMKTSMTFGGIGPKLALLCFPYVILSLSVMHRYPEFFDLSFLGYPYVKVIGFAWFPRHLFRRKGGK